MSSSCIAYVCVSADLTVSEQRAEIEAYAASRESPILRWYVDTTEAPEPRLRERVMLLDAIGAARAERAHLVVARRDLAGDVLTCAMIEYALGKRECLLLSADSERGDDHPDYERIRLAVADFENLLFGTNLRAVWARKRARGEHNGKVPYGFHVGPDGRRLEPDEGEAKIIGIARHMRGMGHKLPAIMNFLNESGLRTRAGTKFNTARVSQIVKGVRKGALLPLGALPKPWTATWDEAVEASAGTALVPKETLVPKTVGPEPRRPPFWETPHKPDRRVARTAILVTAVAGMDILVLGAAPVLWDVRVQEVASARLPAELPAALVQSAVIVVVSNNKDASRAFGLGADDVLRAGEVTEKNLESAIATASVRAAARDVAFCDDPAEPGLALLRSAFGEEVGKELFEPPVGARCAGGFDPTRHPVPSSQHALGETALDLASADVRTEIEDIVRLFREGGGPTADVSIEKVAVNLRTAIPRRVVRFVIATQLAAAVHAAKASAETRLIVVRVRVEEGIAVVEVECAPSEQGEPAGADLDSALVLRALVDRAAHLLADVGGELLVDQGLLRAILPLDGERMAAPLGDPKRPRSERSKRS